MKNIEEELPEDPDQSAIANQDAEFENRFVDPGFVFEEAQEGSDDNSEQEEEIDPPATDQDDQGTQRGAPGLGELDGTNPGSNHHPMDNS